MSKRDNGGYAFPRDGRSPFGPQDGMTLRDWFAGQALAGLSANSAVSLGLYPTDEFASNCFAIADAMLEARK